MRAAASATSGPTGRRRPEAGAPRSAVPVSLIGGASRHDESGISQSGISLRVLSSGSGISHRGIYAAGREGTRTVPPVPRSQWSQPEAEQNSTEQEETQPCPGCCTPPPPPAGAADTKPSTKSPSESLRTTSTGVARPQKSRQPAPGVGRCSVGQATGCGARQGWCGGEEAGVGGAGGRGAVEATGRTAAGGDGTACTG